VTSNKRQIAAARVVVVDTNGFGGGRLNKSDLENIRALSAAGVKVVIPDVVCHELSSHTIGDFSRVPFALLESLGLDVGESRTVQASSASASVYRRVVEAIEDAGAEVRKSLSEWWQEGLMRQVYQAPPAETKSSVKTGAIDTIISRHLASVIAEYGQGLLITNDGPLTKYCEALSYSVVKTFQEAKSRVLSNASTDNVAELLNLMYVNDDWFAAFRRLVEGFDSRSSIENMTLLGLANLVSRDSELQGTILFKASERVLIGRPDGPEPTSETYGPNLYTIEAQFAPDTLIITGARTLQELDMTFDNRFYPLPQTVDAYLANELPAVCSPQVDIRFDAETVTKSNGTEALIRAYVDDKLTVKIRLASYVIRVHQFDFEYDDVRGEVSFEVESGVELEVESIAHRGQLGADLVRLWLKARRINATAPAI
jgi:hypothetical protein